MSLLLQDVTEDVFDILFENAAKFEETDLVISFFHGLGFLEHVLFHFLNRMEEIHSKLLQEGAQTKLSNGYLQAILLL